LSFSETNYRAGDNIIPPFDRNEKLTVVFAGVGTSPNLLANITDSEARDASEAHIVFPLSVIRQVAPQMIAAKFGRFIFLGSSQGSRGIVGATLYTTLKAAHRGLSRSVAVEYGRFGITSNVVDAGFMDGGQARFLKKGARESFLKATPSRQPVKVADIASTIQYLIQSPSVNGAILTVDAAG
jgi:NAD(P)-dependent dehydrogenase (short-subunit alcohol dehydrogenase family)